MFYFCHQCLTPCWTKQAHRCSTSCPTCFSSNRLLETPMTCMDCHKGCRSLACFQRHKVPNKKGNPHAKPGTDVNIVWSTCLLVEKNTNAANINVPAATNTLHMNTCYLRIKPPQKQTTLFMYFDFKCTQSSGEHNHSCVIGQTV